MPELPEVETIKNQLQKLIVGKKIKKVEVFLPRIVKLPLNNFKKIIIGATIKKISRRAKILIFELSNSWSMLLHLKLSGRLIFRKKNEALQPEDTKWNHLIYYFTDESRLFHNDLRQFGYVKLVKTKELTDFFEKEKLGPEPQGKDFTFNKFLAILKRKSKTKIKQFLMNQQSIAGIGNIYSDEILFFAGIHPLKKIADLEDGEIKKIFAGIKQILSAAIKFKGSSTDLYLDALGQKGKYASKLKIYGQEGKKCNRCGTIIKRIKLAARSAHFCPKCQK